MWTNPLIRVWSHNQQKLGIVHVVMANTSLRLFVWLVCGFVFFVFWLHLKSCIHTAWISCCIIYCTSNFILLFWWEMAPNLWDPNMKRSNAKCQLVFFSRRYFILGWRASMRVYIYIDMFSYTPLITHYCLIVDDQTPVPNPSSIGRQAEGWLPQSNCVHLPHRRVVCNCWIGCVVAKGQCSSWPSNMDGLGLHIVSC